MRLRIDFEDLRVAAKCLMLEPVEVLRACALRVLGAQAPVIRVEEDDAIFVVTDQFVVDKHGNKASIKRFETVETCKKALLSSTGCTDCLDCVNCIGCTGCTRCVACRDLVGCHACRACENCQSCRGCKGCKDCVGCTGCEKCFNCSQCRNCSTSANLVEADALSNVIHQGA